MPILRFKMLYGSNFRVRVKDKIPYLTDACLRGCVALVRGSANGAITAASNND